jgi:hypothetical protein
MTREGKYAMGTPQNGQTAYRPWSKPVWRALQAMLIGVYGQLAIALLVWLIIDSPDQIGALGELGIKFALVLVEAGVLLLLLLDKEPLRKYVHVRSWRNSLLLGLVCAGPLIAANRVTHGWIIRFIHGEFDFYRQLTGSNTSGAAFLLLQIVYYLFEIFVLVYAYAKLAEGVRLWNRSRPLHRWVVVVIGGAFLFVTWSLAHGFVLADMLSFGIGLYLPFVFAFLYETTDSMLAPAITWLLFLAI